MSGAIHQNVRPLLHTIVRSAVEATDAAEGWLFEVDGGQLRVVAAVPLHDGSQPAGLRAPADQGVAGYAVSSGQPLALSVRGDEAQLGGGLERQLGRAPSSVLCVPCDHGGEIVGALQLLDKGVLVGATVRNAGTGDAPEAGNGGGFSFDDVEVVSLLSGIAGAALAEEHAMRPGPSPEELGRRLGDLATSEPTRYASVAALVQVLVADG